MWGFVLGGISIVALYCFILFYFFVDPYSFQWKAIYGETTYPAQYTIRGIDISHYQERIDWAKLRNANMGNDPVSFVIIKATEGVSLIDDHFNENFYQARKNGLIRGAYHFLTPDISATKQAEFFLRQAHLEEGDLPPVLDIEDERKWHNSGKNKSQIQHMALEWLSVVEKHYGVRPIIYSSYRFRRDILTDRIFDDYPFWMAHYYVSQPSNDIPWTFWQHTDCGKLSGIRGPVDCNVFHGTTEDLNNLLIKNSVE
jgi:lysozyme